MADTLWTGKNSNKMYEQSGNFTSTVKVSLLASSISTECTGISPHNDDEIFLSDHQYEKTFKLSGKFTTVVRQSVDHSAYLYSAQGVSPDEVNTLVGGDGADLGEPDDEEMYLMSGKITSTIKASLRTGLTWDEPLDVSSDGINSTFCIPAEFILLSGQITTTVKESLTGIRSTCEGIGWDGRDTLSCHYSGDWLMRYSGRFTTTVRDSLVIVTHDGNPEGIESSNFNLRVGVGNFVDITLPSMGLTTMNVIVFPMLSVVAYDYNSFGMNTLPMLTMTAWAQQGNEVRITLPSLGMASYANPGNNTINITLPFITIDAPPAFHGDISITLPPFGLTNVTYQGEVYNVGVSMPMLTVSIEVGKRLDLSMPSLTVSATGSNGIVAIFNRNLPRMIVSATGTQHFLANGNIVLPSFVINGNLLTGIVSVAGSRSIPMLKLNAHAFQGVHGSASIVLPQFSLTTEVIINPSGNGAIGLRMFTIEAYADVHINRFI